MNQTIFLPSDDETRQLMEHAWQEFQQQAGTAGMTADTLSLMHDIFIWGYCAGHNDTLLLIRDQMAVSDLAAEAMKTTNE